jgi:hypothetical protein
LAAVLVIGSWAHAAEDHQALTSVEPMEAAEHVVADHADRERGEQGTPASEPDTMLPSDLSGR